MSAAAAPSSLPVLPIQFTDYAHWQNARLRDGSFAAHAAYWRRPAGRRAARLGRGRPTIPRPPRPTLAGVAPGVRLPADLAPALDRYPPPATAPRACRRCWPPTRCALRRWSGHADLVIGLPIGNRAHPETQHLIGPAAGALPLRIRVAEGAPAGELVRQVHATLQQAVAHQDYPFAQMVRDLAPLAGRPRARVPGPVRRAAEPGPARRPRPGCAWRQSRSTGASRSSICRWCWPSRATSCAGGASTAATCFTRETAAAFAALVCGGGRPPVSMIRIGCRPAGAPGRRAMSNPLRLARPEVEQTIGARFAQVAGLAGPRGALRAMTGDRITYAELDEWTNAPSRVGSEGAGCRPATCMAFLAVTTERGAVAAALGIQRAGHVALAVSTALPESGGSTRAAGRRASRPAAGRRRRGRRQADRAAPDHAVPVTAAARR
jgi:hypothetical protein